MASFLMTELVFIVKVKDLPLIIPFYYVTSDAEKNPRD